MGHGIFGKLTGYVDEAGKGVPDQRSREHNFKIEYSDAIKSAEAVFFFQHPSLPSFQRAMQERKKRNNEETLFGVKEIPCDNEIRGLLDTIEPDIFGDIFMKSLKLADEQGVLEGYRVLDGEFCRHWTGYGTIHRSIRAASGVCISRKAGKRPITIRGWSGRWSCRGITRCCR